MENSAEYFLSPYFLVQSPRLPTMNAVKKSIEETNESYELLYDQRTGTLRAKCKNEPKSKLFMGIAWYRVMEGLQP